MKKSEKLHRGGKRCESAGKPALYSQERNGKRYLFFRWPAVIVEAPSGTSKGKSKTIRREEPVIIDGRRLLLLPEVKGSPDYYDIKALNEEILNQAKQKQAELEGLRIAGKTSAFAAKTSNNNFHSFCRNYLEQNKDLPSVRCLACAYNRFCDYLKATYKEYAQVITYEQMTDKDLCKGFRDYLVRLKPRTNKKDIDNDPDGRGIGKAKAITDEAAATSLSRFKTIVNAAVDKGLIPFNPFAKYKLSIHIDRNKPTKKEVLYPKELQDLINADGKGLNEEVRRAFVFCAVVSGQAEADVREFRYEGIDYQAHKISYTRAKDGITASHTFSERYWPSVLMLVGEPPTTSGGKVRRGQRVFPNLPTTANGCNYSLEDWIKRAGIDKHITWYSARHTLLTWLANSGYPIQKAKRWAGHTNITQTDRYYIDAPDEPTADFANGFPLLDLSNISINRNAHDNE
jgi:integrase